MKRYGNLWEKFITEENFILAYKNAKKNKSKLKSVQNFAKNWATKLEKIRQNVKNFNFHTAGYKQKTIYEPKERIIYILPFKPDRIVQHAVMNILTPIFEKLFIKDSYACIKGRGQHKGSLRCMEFVRRNKYCLKCDIRKFYPSIDQSILYYLIEKVIKDKMLLCIIKDIVFSFKGGKNVPIGNLTSQWFGNFYMTPLDRVVKQELKVKDYIRYCDDFCLFSNDKQFLRQCKERIKEYINKELSLEFSKCDIFNTKQGVDFLGYRHFKDYILVRKNTAKRLIKSVTELPILLADGRLTKEEYRSKVASAYGVLKHANSYNLQVKLQINILRDKIKKEIEEERRLRRIEKARIKELKCQKVA